MRKTNRFILIALSLVLLLPSIGQASSEKGSILSRVSGSNRIETAIELSKLAYTNQDQVDTVFLAGYNGDADALAANFLAGQLHAPLLLVRKDKLDKEVLNEIERLNPREIVVLGGEAVVSENVVDELKKQDKDQNYKIKRIKGSSRIETAVNIAKDYLDKAVEYGAIGDKKLEEVFIVDYHALVDALAIGPVSARDGIPILIIKNNQLPDEVKDFLQDYQVERATIVGGNNTVGGQGKEELEEYLGQGQVDRVYGSNRIGTSLEIAKEYFIHPQALFLANGWNNADALLGGYFAAMTNGPILLSKKDRLDKGIEDYISQAKIKSYILGGEAVIGEDVFNLVDWLLGTPIISETKSSVEQMEAWAKGRGATETFISLAEKFVKISKESGVNPEGAYVQSALETGFGKFGGVIDESFHNTCGLKTRDGGPNDDPDAHQRFKSWEEGIEAHLDHLALYAGAKGYPKKDTPDPRHFPGILGTAKTFRFLEGKWATSSGYGNSLENLLVELYNTKVN